MEQLILHLFGDYFLQSDWMALHKSKKWWPALVHVTLYTLPFLLITTNWVTLTIIWLTHLLIDRFSLAKYLCFLKNKMAPGANSLQRWRSCKVTGYFDHWNEEERLHFFDANDSSAKVGGRPFHLTLVLYIVSDNTLHLICNYLALTWGVWFVT